MNARGVAVAAIAAGFLLPLAAPASGCPLCFGSTPYELGLYWSVLFLLPAPFVILGVLLVWIHRQSQGKDRSGPKPQKT